MATKRGAKRDKREVFLAELSRHGSIRKACHVAGVSRTTVREWKQDQDFAVAMADAEEDSVDRVEEVGHGRALKGDEKLIRFILEVKRYKKDSSASLGEVRPTINITIGGSNGRAQS